ncbi:MAG: 3-deoxy-D-manno-octulosonic acid transferase [Desulfomonile tiedjei]|nr:3-deoxy-D-manno-octulosonic acid transferase [Desulfomonile tiedjei]
MNRFLYNVFLHTLVAPFLAAYYLPKIALRSKYRRSLSGKLGRLPESFVPETLARPRIWFHAVSVGEVVALSPLVAAVKELTPSASVIVSTGTETGQDQAAEMIPEADGLIYLPLDFPAFVDPVVQRIQPDLFVLMETELWPNLIHSLKKTGAKVALANGRISDRSFPRYKRLRALFSPVLEQIDLFLMSSDSDARRISEMAAPASRIQITGNTKFDAALTEIPVEAEERIRDMFSLAPNAKVFVAGSTHPGEHEMVLDAYLSLREEFPDLVLILVPRHIERTPSIIAAMKDRNMAAPFLRSSVDQGTRRRDEPVIIVDCTGELFQVFSVASLVFMGGSLVPKGGQNILEPAAWGKVVMFGPSMEDFRDARDILVRAGAGREVAGTSDLVKKATEVLSNPQEAERLGKKGREEILRQVGSAKKNAELLTRLIGAK